VAWINNAIKICRISLALAGLSGCASSVATLQSRSAGVIGVPPEQVQISDMRTDSSSTYCIATVGNSSYVCVAEGGTVKFMQLGMTNPPSCTKR